MMEKCNRCGAENYDGSNFCQNCGASLNNHKHSSTPNKNLIDRFKDANIFIKLIIIIVAVFVFLVAFAWASHIFLGIPLEPYTEGDATYRASEFERLDTDGDGALSIYEVGDLASGIVYDDFLNIFDLADKNDNGVLKGAEFDGYIYQINKYNDELENQKTSQHVSSSASGNSKSVKYIDACPECGSEEIIDYIDSTGHRIYQCSSCDYESYDEDDFAVEVNCILPVLENNLAVAGVV